ncbi:MAG: dihydroorotase [Burkholderiales bacterium]
MHRITFTLPDDWHVHLRDGDEMRTVVADTARRFARAIIMPNLTPPVTTTKMAMAYRSRILTALPKRSKFEPLMTLYLTGKTGPQEIVKAKQSSVVHGVKYYPAGATTHSDSGVNDLNKCFAALEEMQKQDMPLLVHGEVTNPEVDVFDREKVFIERMLLPLAQRFPRLRIVFEHITTREAVEYVKSASDNIAATITAHHLLLNRNAMFSGGLCPHHYCLPVLKREVHRQALIKAATSGNPKFFLGSDSAPHTKNAKEAGCGCAGIYTAHAAIELYTEAFEQAEALDKLEGFASFHGSDFYRLPRNADKITLARRSWKVPRTLRFGKESLVPLRAGEAISWQLV